MARSYWLGLATGQYDHQEHCSTIRLESHNQERVSCRPCDLLIDDQGSFREVVYIGIGLDILHDH